MRGTKLDECGVHTGGRNADDTMIVVDGAQDLSVALKKLRAASNKQCLKLNYKKTKAMIISKHYNSTDQVKVVEKNIEMITQ